MANIDEATLQRIANETSNITSSFTGTSVNGATGLASLMGENSIVNTLTCSPGTECYRTKRNNYLKKKLETEKTNYYNAPIDLSRAEKNYYIYNNGESGGERAYSQVIIDRFSKTADQFKQNSIEMQQEFMAGLSQSIKQYQAALLFQKQMDNLLQLRQNEQKNLIKNINYYQTILQTSERKVVYENKNMDNLYTYRRIMVFLYYAALICFIIFGNFIPDKLYTKQSVWIVIIIAAIIPIILNIVIMWLYILYDTVSYWFADLPHKDVYRNL
jgi:hypothetical protein